MAAMGLSIVHMGEFAWHRMEPREGEFHFDWLDRCVELARQRKILAESDKLLARAVEKREVTKDDLDAVG